MARWGRTKEEDGARPVASPVPAPPQPLPDAPGPGTTTEREARKRLRKAETDLKRLERKEQRFEKARERRERAMDRRLVRIQRARLRPITPMAAMLLGLHGFAASMAILHLLFPEIVLYRPLLYDPSPHWELIAICYVAAVVGSIGLVAGSPAVDFQQRARQSGLLYIAMSVIITLVGLLLVLVLEPMEGFDLDWVFWHWVMFILIAGSALPMAFLFLLSRWSDSQAFFDPRYHLAMGVLTAILVATLIILPFVFLAWQGMMVEVGLAMTMLGALGMLFALPAVGATFVYEAFYEGLPIKWIALVVAGELVLGLWVLIGALAYF